MTSEPERRPLRLRVGYDELDSVRFERLLQEGRLAGSPGQAGEVLREALAL